MAILYSTWSQRVSKSTGLVPAKANTVFLSASSRSPFFCKLTRSEGKFVRAHVIPSALTPPEVKGAALHQSGLGRQAVKRWTSWYDPKLVTAEGEAALRDLDTWAIQELRGHKLTWSSWGDDAELSAPDHRPVLPDEGWGLREITISDPDRLRLFFLSLLSALLVSGGVLIAIG